MAMNKGRVCVTGGCGFIGSHLVHRLVAEGWEVVVYDNLSVGNPAALPACRRISLIQGDVRDQARLRSAVADCDLVYHFAAPTDVRAALKDPHQDVDQIIGGTHTLLEAMRLGGVRRVVCASSSCVYGEGLPQPVSESSAPLLPSSVYGAAKLACEALISAYCRTFDFQAWLFRFPNVAGPGVTHGVIRDFVLRLKKDPSQLLIYGDGNQTKTYLYVDDCIDGIITLVRRMPHSVNLANITAAGATTVNRIAQLVVSALGLSGVQFRYTGGAGGWRGDVSHIVLDGSLAASLGWRARHTSDEAVDLTIRWLVEKTSHTCLQ
ncbi:MAG: SDR family NAD(P)-dependent oxidoreductase [Armatimonadota bacterium]|nr:SDR family NAD(P)-dependent oxidoreductase [Armatimonadota bacterium]